MTGHIPTAHKNCSHPLRTTGLKSSLSSLKSTQATFLITLWAFAFSNRDNRKGLAPDSTRIRIRPCDDSIEVCSIWIWGPVLPNELDWYTAWTFVKNSEHFIYCCRRQQNNEAVGWWSLRRFWCPYMAESGTKPQCHNYHKFVFHGVSGLDWPAVLGSVTF